MKTRRKTKKIKDEALEKKLEGVVSVLPVMLTKAQKEKEIKSPVALPDVPRLKPKLVSKTEMERRINEGLVEEYAERGGTLSGLLAEFPWVKNEKNKGFLRDYFKAYRKHTGESLQWVEDIKIVSKKRKREESVVQAGMFGRRVENGRVVSCRKVTLSWKLR